LDWLSPRPRRRRTNIVVIMGDDIGVWISALSPRHDDGQDAELDKIARGLLFTDHYAEASCTAGRAAFVTGQLPIRTGMTTVGQAGAPTGLPAQAATIGTALKSLGYATGQFGKNHLGDKNEFLAAAARFDEFFGYLYHLDAMEIRASTTEGTARQGRPRQHGPLVCHRQGRLPPWIRAGARSAGRDRGRRAALSQADGDRWMKDPRYVVQRGSTRPRPTASRSSSGSTHTHARVTHLSPKYEAMRNSQNGWSLQEAGMAQLDDVVGDVMKKLKDMGVDDNTIVIFTTTTAPNLYLARRRQHAVPRQKGTIYEGGFPRAGDDPLPGKVPAGKVENGIMSGLDWFPTLVAAAGNPNIKDELLKGKQMGGRTYKNHLDSYNQMD